MTDEHKKMAKETADQTCDALLDITQRFLKAQTGDDISSETIQVHVDALMMGVADHLNSICMSLVAQTPREYREAFVENFKEAAQLRFVKILELSFVLPRAKPKPKNVIDFQPKKGS